MATINLEKHIWEGWRVCDFINDLEPTLDMIMRGGSRMNKFSTKKELCDWITSNQPYYKKPIKDVQNYFIARYKL